MQLYLSWFSDFDTSDISIFQEGPYMEDSAGEFWIWDKGMVMTLIILCMKKPDFIKSVHSFWEPFGLGRQESEKSLTTNQGNLYAQAHFRVVMKSLWLA